MKPYSEACERNKMPILEVLCKAFADCQHVLEVGSGTGQHAVFFSLNLPHLTWQPSDLKENHLGIQGWIDDSPLPNLKQPIELDIDQLPWPTMQTDAVYCSNVFHIVSWHSVRNFFQGIQAVMKPNSVLCVYGPFNYNQQYTSASNQRFDQMLKYRDPLSGIRNFEDVDALAQQAGLVLQDDHAMPANNRCLVWKRNSE